MWNSAWADSISKKRTRVLPCLLMSPRRWRPPVDLLARDQSQIAADLLATAEPIGNSQDQHKGQCGDRSHSGMGHEPLRIRPLFRLLLDRGT